MSKGFSRAVFWCGIAIVVLAIGLFVWSQISVGLNRSKAEEITDTLVELIPDVRRGAPDGRIQTQMPVIELNGKDFVGIIEFPKYGTELPICNRWAPSSVQKYPHRFAGSMYDGSLVIGGSDNSGQIECIEIISIGDYVCVTDVTGEQYVYTVTWVEKTKDVCAERLCDEKYDLTIFARNTYGFEYTVIRCNLK